MDAEVHGMIPSLDETKPIRPGRTESMLNGLVGGVVERFSAPAAFTGIALHLRQALTQVLGGSHQPLLHTI